ncbi:MAG: dihydropteroate synthase [Deltaproteobacteria bacterium]|nr:dihydropteroate synthase [Deltaproteobacteria bacterium]
MISKKIGGAVDRRDPEPIRELARLQAEAGADYLDLNLGPLTKKPGETARWIANTVQEAVDLPLCIDTLNPVALEAVLEVCKKTPMINSANGTQRSKETILPLARKFSADVIMMTINDEGMAIDPDERLEMAMELVEEANSMDIPSDKVWVDAVLMPACVNQEDILRYFEFVKMFPEALPEAKTITGLSNISSCGTPTDVRGLLNRTFFVMLNRYGHSAVIADVLDKELIQLNQGGLPDLETLIHRAMDQETIDMGSLSETEINYVKTVNLLMGNQLYSHSWLEE